MHNLTRALSTISRSLYGLVGSDGLDMRTRVDEQELGLFAKWAGLTLVERRARPDLFRFDFTRAVDGSFVPECSCCGGLGHRAMHCALGAAAAARRCSRSPKGVKRALRVLRTRLGIQPESGSRALS
eukprot:COSAG01_NODE_2472_length_7625_cov_9.664895_1_plen_127_part_00